MKDYKWYSGSNEEEFSNGPFDTREEAIADLDGYGGFVVEAYKSPLELSKFFDVERFLEDAEDHVCDLANENGDLLFDVGVPETRDLQLMVQAAIQAWQIKHNLVFEPYMFTNSRNLEAIAPDDGIDI